MMMKRKKHFVLRIIALAFSVALASGTTSAIHAEDAETGTFILHLYDIINDQAVEGIGFEIAATGKEDTAAVTINEKIGLTGKTDASGDLAVKNLPIGTYYFKIQDDTVPTGYAADGMWDESKNGGVLLKVEKKSDTGKTEAYLQRVSSGARSYCNNGTDKTYLHLSRKETVIKLTCKDVKGNPVVGRTFDIVLDENPKIGIFPRENLKYDKDKYDGKWYFTVTTGEDGIAADTLPFAHYSIYEEAPATAAASYVPVTADISEATMKQDAIDGKTVNVETLVSSLAEGTVTFQTTDTKTGSPIKGASFTLSGKAANGVVLDDNSGQRVNASASLTGTTDDSGNLKIASLGLGTYTLVETIPEGYRIGSAETQLTYTVTVTEDEAQKGIARVTVTDASGAVSKNINRSVYKITHTADPVIDDYKVVNTGVRFQTSM
jgi:hypothetical protein